MNNLSGMFDAVNRQVADVASQIGSTPASFSPGVFALVRNISESVIIPIAGMFLTFIACYELIQLIIEHNNLANFETWIFFKWIFKTFVAVMLITNTFNRIHGGRCGNPGNNTGELGGNGAGRTIGAVSAVLHCPDLFHDPVRCNLRDRLWPYDGDLSHDEPCTDPVLHLRKPGAEPYRPELSESPDGPWLPGIPDHDLYTDDIIGSIWGVMGYTVLLCFSLFKTGSLAKSVMSAH